MRIFYLCKASSRSPAALPVAAARCPRRQSSCRHTQAAAVAALGRSGWRAKKHLSEALTRCDTGRAVGVRSCTAGPLQAPRGINVTALHFHLSPDWPRRSAEESRRGRSQVGVGGWSQAEGGWSQAERSRPPAKTVKCFQTRTVEQRQFGWCLISGGWGRGLWRGRPFVFPASEAPHGRQLPVWEEDEEEKKKVDGDFRPYFQNWVHPRRGKANCVGGE